MPDTYQLNESGASVDALLDVIGTDALTTTAQTLTGAVNEIAGDVGEISNLTTTDKSDIVSAVNEVVTDITSGAWFKRVQYTASYTCAGSGYATVTAEDFGLFVPDGYQVFAIERFSTGSTNCCIRFVDPRATGTTASLGVRNLSASSVKANAILWVIYVKQGIMEDVTPSANSLNSINPINLNPLSPTVVNEEEM